MNLPELPDDANVLSFRARILRAGGWTLGSQFGSQILRLASNLVMTRLLVPQMFGIMAIANVLLMGLQLFSDLGLNQGVVQSKGGNEPAYLNTVWTVQILRGALIWVVALLGAIGLFFAESFHLFPPSTAYADPRLPTLIAVLSFSALLGGLVSTRIAMASRNLALGRVTLMELYSQISAIVVMILWALIDRSIWALVAGSLVSSSVRLTLSHTFIPGEPNRLHWDRDAFRDIFAFGKWIFISSILGFLSAGGDRLLLGGLVDAKTLGVYVTAAFLINALLGLFNAISESVAYPAFSEVVRERPADLIRTYYRFRAPMDVASLVLTGLMFSAGHLIIRLLYDNRYQAAGHMLEILSISLFEVRYGLASFAMMALGKPKILTPIILVRLVVLFTLMPWAFKRFGLDASIWVVSGSLLLTMPVTFLFIVRYHLFNLRRELIVLPWLGIGYGLGVAADGLARLSVFVR